MKKNIIPVIFAADDNVLQPLNVAVVSLMENASKTTDYNIYILVDEKFSEENKGIFYKIQNKYSRHSIEFLHVSKKYFMEVKIKNFSLTVTTFYRLLAARILPHLKKAIYLDCDVVICGDLSELYNVDLDMYYIAGVKDFWAQEEVMYTNKYMLELGLESMETYINAGVLLLNLEKIRINGTTKLFLDAMKRNYSRNDQDVLNIVCINKIKYLHVKFNYMVTYDLLNRNCANKVFSREEMEEAKKDLKILHFSGMMSKPWQNEKVRYSEIWWKYANIALRSECKKQINVYMQSWMKKRDFAGLLNICKNKNKIYIFGFSEKGKELYHIMKKNINNMDIGIIDNSLQKQEKEYEGIRVKSPLAIQKQENLLVIIISQLYGKDMILQLEEMGICKDNIIEYYAKSVGYYLSLKDECFEEEIDLILMEWFGKPDIYQSLPLKQKIELLRNSNDSDKIREKYWLDLWLPPI